ncbi:hypothetical protein VHEMI02740 [[Torrubiella] hemipterigena]|uniref:Uncharacterized protein n=1 Tax=[Torrubiella] hemipterigena TaxID=1531966 RepID=A0A0A1SWP5_9HYPO|nr:hypothetical protein VHEMI02740 [[Torrubiella] hemipterigena]
MSACCLMSTDSFVDSGESISTSSGFDDRTDGGGSAEPLSLAAAGPSHPFPFASGLLDSEDKWLKHAEEAVSKYHRSQYQHQNQQWDRTKETMDQIPRIQQNTTQLKAKDDCTTASFSIADRRPLSPHFSPTKTPQQNR